MPLIVLTEKEFWPVHLVNAEVRKARPFFFLAPSLRQLFKDTEVMFSFPADCPSCCLPLVYFLLLFLSLSLPRRRGRRTNIKWCFCCDTQVSGHHLPVCPEKMTVLQNHCKMQCEVLLLLGSVSPSSALIWWNSKS